MSNNSQETFSLHDITTYQSGVIQASAIRSINRYTAEFLERYSLTAMQWFMIGVIYDHGTAGVRVSDLARLLDTTMAYTTQVVNGLEACGIVTKRADIKDGRTKWLTIVPGYRKKCRTIEEELRTHLRTLIYKDVSPDELTIYIKVLYKLNSLAGNSNEL